VTNWYTRYFKMLIIILSNSVVERRFILVNIYFIMTEHLFSQIVRVLVDIYEIINIYFYT